jgi:hypothetical protein
VSIKDHFILATVGKLWFCTDCMLGFMGSGKPSSLVITLSNRTSLLRGGLMEGGWGSPGCCAWDPKGHTYDVLVMFFLCRVYIDSNHHDTFGYEWPRACCCHLVVCLVVLRIGLEDYGYDYRGYALIMLWITSLILALCMLYFIGATLIPGLIKMAKILKVRINC